MVRESMTPFLRNLLARGLPSARGRIIVSGMPKSGTTAIAMLMGAAAGLRVNSDPFNRMDEAGIQFRDALYSRSLGLAELLNSYGQVFGMAVFDHRDAQGRLFLEKLAHPGRSVGGVCFCLRNMRIRPPISLRYARMPSFSFSYQ